MSIKFPLRREPKQGKWYFWRDEIAIAFTGRRIDVMGRRPYPLGFQHTLENLAAYNKGRIGHFLKRTFSVPKNPVLFNRWFLGVLEEQGGLWPYRLELWKMQAVSEIKRRATRRRLSE